VINKHLKFSTFLLKILHQKLYFLVIHLSYYISVLAVYEMQIEIIEEAKKLLNKTVIL